jgi:hypothetical protein
MLICWFRRNLSDVGSDTRVAEGRLIQTIVLPHEGGDEIKSRFSIGGPLIVCGDHATNGGPMGNSIRELSMTASHQTRVSTTTAGAARSADRASRKVGP